MILVQSPFDFYAERDGSPLDSGFLYFGTPNLDPVTNPIAAWWDEAGTVPAAQPIRTAGGYSVNGSTPANVYVAGAYSMSIVDRHGQLVAYMPSVTAATVSATTINASTLNATAVNASGTVTAATVTASGTVNAATIAATGNITAVNIGATGGIAATNLSATSNITTPTFNATSGAELGTIGVSNAPFLDFHSGATGTDYDSRLVATGGTGVNGAGALQYLATAGHLFSGDVTLMGVNMNVHKSLAVNGYQRLPGGLILQWGSAFIPGITGTTVTFPLAFPNACLNVAASSLDNGPAFATFQGLSVTGVMVQKWSGTTQTGGTVQWIAIGY